MGKSSAPAPAMVNKSEFKLTIDNEQLTIKESLRDI